MDRIKFSRTYVSTATSGWTVILLGMADSVVKGQLRVICLLRQMMVPVSSRHSPLLRMCFSLSVLSLLGCCIQLLYLTKEKWFQ